MTNTSNNPGQYILNMAAKQEALIQLTILTLQFEPAAKQQHTVWTSLTYIQYQSSERPLIRRLNTSMLFQWAVRCRSAWKYFCDSRLKEWCSCSKNTGPVALPLDWSKTEINRMSTSLDGLLSAVLTKHSERAAHEYFTVWPLQHKLINKRTRGAPTTHKAHSVRLKPLRKHKS